MAKDTKNTETTVEKKPELTNNQLQEMLEKRKKEVANFHKERKQISWRKLGQTAYADFPDGRVLEIDMTVYDTELTKFYGVKQLTSDSVSGEKGYDDKYAGMKAFFDEVKEHGLEIVGNQIRIKGKVRQNATGAAENKRIADNMRSTAKTVTLNGLLAKKMLAAQGGEAFTDDDQKKLDEFLMAMAKDAVKNSKKK